MLLATLKIGNMKGADTKTIASTGSAVTMMGISLSFLLATDLGVDTCSFMNNSIAEAMGLPIGPVMVSINIVLFAIQLAFARHLIGWGTVLNMFMIGPVADLVTFTITSKIPAWIFSDTIPRALVFVPSIAIFVTSAAIYMNTGLGLSPFDAMPRIIDSHLPLPRAIVRMAGDFLAIGIGLITGGSLNIGTVILALSLGPVVSLVGRALERWKDDCQS